MNNPNAPQEGEQKKSMMTWSKKELLYGFIVIFLLLIVYFSGEITTAMILENVRRECPNITVASASPFGVAYVKGIYTANQSTPIGVP